MTSSDKEFNDIENCLKQADFEFKQRRFESAAPLYDRALKLLKESRPSGHGDIIYCQENLADAQAFAGEYSAAHETLLEALEVRKRVPGTKNVDLIATKFRVAKMLEMARDVPGALAAYDDCATLAEQSLYAGHPLLLAIYKAELKVLQVAGGSDSEIAQIERKLGDTASGATAVADNFLESMHLKDYCALELPPLPVQEEERRPLIKLPIALIRNLCLVVVALAIAGAGAHFYLTQEGKKKEQAIKLNLANSFQGQTFESADGQSKLVFLPGAKVDAVIDGLKRQLPIEVLPSDANLSSDSQTDRRRAFQQVPNAMLADDGSLLYSKDSPESKVVARVATVAACAQKYFDQHREYPQASDELEAIDAKVDENPVSAQSDRPIFVGAAKERDWSGDGEPKAVATLRSGALLPGEAPFLPGSVHCYTFLTGDKYQEGVKCQGFFIRASDGNGKLLSQGASKTFVAVMLAGRESEVAGVYHPKLPGPLSSPLQLVRIIMAK